MLHAFPSCSRLHAATNGPRFIDPFISRWTLGLLPPFGYCEYCCCDPVSVPISVRSPGEMLGPNSNTMCDSVRSHPCLILSAPQLLALASQKRWPSVLEWGPPMGVLNKGLGEPWDSGRFRKWLSSTSESRLVLLLQGRGGGARPSPAGPAAPPPCLSLLPPPAPQCETV